MRSQIINAGFMSVKFERRAEDSRGVRMVFVIFPDPDRAVKAGGGDLGGGDEFGGFDGRCMASIISRTRCYEDL